MLTLIIHSIVVLLLILWEVKNFEYKYIHNKDCFDTTTAVLLIAVTVIKIALILLAAYLI